MNFFKIISIFYFILYFTTFSNSTKIENSKNLISGKLENGLEYYIFKNEKPKNRASLALIVKSGSLLEKDNQQGLAHFLEHMAFNGTEKYKKNDLVKYLQSLGLSFGGDLNAYTSFEETVFELKVPTTKQDLNTAFDVFNEWASKITLDQKAIDDEKNIIIEEWRLNQGINQRVGDLQKKIIFGDSLYSKRFPIGKVENIKLASTSLLKDYYNSWYQPKNMAIVAVGDFNVDDIKVLINKNLGVLKNNSVQLKNLDTSIPLSKNSVTIFTDKELTSTNLDIIWKKEFKPLNTREEFKNNLVISLLNSILNNNFSILSKEKTNPFLGASAFSFSLNNKMGIYGLSASVKENKVLPTIDILITNLKKIAQVGITKEELEKEKLNYLNSLEVMVNNKSSITNESYKNQIKNYVLNEESFIEIDKEYLLTKEIFNEISVKDLQDFTKNILSKNYDIFITSRENLKNSLPKNSEIKNSIESLIKKKINFKLENYSSSNLNKILKAPGNIVSSKDFKDYKTFNLSNGLKVLYKKTDFDKDKIFISLIKKQGSSSLNYNNYINSIFLPKILSESGVGNIDYKNLNQYFKGKDFDVSFFIDDYTQGISIVSDNKNLNEALKYFNASIYSPIFSSEILDTTLEEYSEIIKNRVFSPKSNFKNEILKLSSSNHPRRKLLELDDLKVVNIEALNDTFNKLFKNFNGYTISIVGSIDEVKVKDICSKYFASLPVEKTSIFSNDLKVRFPKNISKKIVTQGIDKKSTVCLIYPFKEKITPENIALFNAFSEVLNILLIEEVREKIGGVYTISSIADISQLNYKENSLQIFFSTDTKRANEIINEVQKVIDKIQKGNFPKEKIEYIKQNYKLNFETLLKTNGFWSNFLNKKNLISNYEFYTPMMYNKIVNYNSLITFAKKSIDLNNYVEVILVPEKEN